MMIRTDRRRFPILLAAIAALALAMALLFSTVQAQEGLGARQAHGPLRHGVPRPGGPHLGRPQRR